MTEPDGLESFRAETPSSAGWATFEARVRGKRFARCIERANAAIDQGATEAAREAINEARVLMPDAPEITELESRIVSQPGPTAVLLAAAERPELEADPGWLRVAGAMALLLVLFGLFGFGLAYLYFTEPAQQLLSAGAAKSSADGDAPREAGTLTKFKGDSAAKLPAESDRITNQAATPIAPETPEPTTRSSAAVQNDLPRATPPSSSSPKREPEKSTEPSASLRLPTAPVTNPVMNRGSSAASTSGASPRSSSGPGPGRSAGSSPGPAPRLGPGLVNVPPRTDSPAPTSESPARPSSISEPLSAVANRPEERQTIADAPTPAPVGPLPAPPPPVQARIPASASSPDVPIPAARTASTGQSKVDESERIRSVLARYETAYNRLDANAASSVWPSVNEAALDRAFKGLLSQRVSLGLCDITVIGDIGGASCAGKARWEPRIGGGVQTADRHWTFNLRKSGDNWKIEQIRVR
jgi:hypothetical protein